VQQQMYDMLTRLCTAVWLIVTCCVNIRLEPEDPAEQEALEQRRTTSSDLNSGRSVRRHTMGRQTSFGTTL
jgi:hypothetical protein